MFPHKIYTGGADRVRTCDPHNAIVVLYQLSYDPDQSAAQSKVSAALVKTFFHFPRRKLNSGQTLNFEPCAFDFSFAP